MTKIEVWSSAFVDHSPLPDRFAKETENVSPPLNWSSPPPETAEVAIICEDPDAPSGTWIHWLVAGIDPQLTALEEGSVPAGTSQGRTSYGQTGYGGPRPPVGDSPHRYFFKVFACGQPLHLDEGFDKDAFYAAVETSELASGVIVGTYAR